MSPPRAAARSLPLAAALFGAAPLVALLALLLAANPNAPRLDDYDAILRVLCDVRDAASPGERVALLFSHHNEHRPVVLRATALAVHGLLGPLDFRVLNALGGLALAGIAAALLFAFAPAEPFARRLVAFAPAPLWLAHPQYANALLWPSCSLTAFPVVLAAALCLAALARRGAGSAIGAGIAAGVATLSLGNGILVLPLGALVAALAGAPRRARLWAVFAVPVVLAYAVCYDPPPRAASPLLALQQPGDLLRYFLHLLGSAAGFGSPGPSLFAGVALVASSAALAARGLPRRNPALFGLLLFLLASAAANALLRAGQGAEASLVQPRYRFHASALLAVTWLGWAELLLGRGASRPARGRRALPLMALALAVAFSAASFAARGGALASGAGRLEAGLEQWWTRGSGGLVHPRPERAEATLLRALDGGVWRAPQRWVVRHAVAPEPVALPEAGGDVVFELRALFQAGDAVGAAGVAYGGSSARGQRGWLVLRSPQHTLALPALAVLRRDLPRGARSALGRSGFRVLARRRDLPPGRYRVGVLVRGASGTRLSYSERILELAGAAGR